MISQLPINIRNDKNDLAVPEPFVPHSRYFKSLKFEFIIMVDVTLLLFHSQPSPPAHFRISNATQCKEWGLNSKSLFDFSCYFSNSIM